MLLSQICALQKAYGKTEHELETLVEGFSWALSDYEMPDILKAMRLYITTHSDIPAPNDIIQIINRMQEYEALVQPSIETLLRYESKGIPLTQAQKEQLEKHRSQQA
jgi:hypothetical protein